MKRAIVFYKPTIIDIPEYIKDDEIESYTKMKVKNAFDETTFHKLALVKKGVNISTLKKSIQESQNDFVNLKIWVTNPEDI